MKTIYSIGRDPSCDIYLHDDNNIISRNHAILKVGKGGKYFIVDQSMNGTYINGIKVSQGVQIPVTRKDVISFAHVAELDWNQIPNSGYVVLKIALISLAAAVILGVGGYYGYEYMNSRGANSIVINPTFPVDAEVDDTQKKDTVVVEVPPVVKESESKPKNEKKVKKEVKKETVETPSEVQDTVKHHPFV